MAYYSLVVMVKDADNAKHGVNQTCLFTFGFLLSESMFSSFEVHLVLIILLNSVKILIYSQIWEFSMLGS